MQSRNTQRPSIRFILFFIDLISIIWISSILDLSNPFNIYFCVYCSVAWFVVANILGFYEVFRFTPLLKILYLLLKQFAVFGIVIFSFFGLSQNISYEFQYALKYLLYTFVTIGFAKIFVFTILKNIRIKAGKNLRRVVILGSNSKTKKLSEFFTTDPAYGYILVKLFNFKTPETSLKSAFTFIKENAINEIYCSISEFSNKEIAQIVAFADNNFITLKFLPDSKEVLSRKLQFQYYGITPIISIREIPLDHFRNKVLKRFFDILVASLVFITILSWLTPLLAILIKLESKGPVFYKHVRNGLGYKEFHCYKFRSMKWRDPEDIDQVIKDDARVTKIGRFLRRTSIDELPQFYNVLLGEMSVVGPRPHMVKYNEDYIKRVERFMVRHLIKPGITGLAQISGYRGEVEKDSDIINRVRYDIFYLENWSLLMDVRIIAKTIVQLIKGDPKAY